MRRSFTIARCALTSTRGVAAVEFALIAPVLFLILFGTLELGRLFWIRNSLQFAAEEAGRYAMVMTNATADLKSIEDQAKNCLSSLDVEIAVVPDAAGGISFVTVTVTYQFEFLSGLLPAGSFVLSSKSRVPVS